ncbi:50S ribosomal protein L16 [Candidatus Vidania fulgoroideae]|uniref:50S ribosomal protein L16 n=1 Tax=Candidatus Vidania fulgoroideorum TaxID=881286 RepID=A0A974X7J6_9PROT|nr:50S ribosomal protein L16 [Candidatus Vidania fulgoroideae]
MLSNFKKFRKGRNRGNSCNSNKLSFCRYGLKSISSGRLNSKQLESGRKMLSKHIKKTGKVILRIKPFITITKKPIEVRMGSGKGDIHDRVFKVKPGNVIYEIDSENRKTAFMCLRKSGMKLPIRTKIIEFNYG